MVMLPLPMTPWQRHKQRWGKGCGSDLCKKANRVVLARGSLPCDVLFVGEAPGKGENLSGVPFCGPAGQLLDQMIAKAVAQIPFTFALTNLTGCIPLNSDGAKVHEPEACDVEQCSERLLDMIDNVARPRVIIAVGRAAEKWLDPKYAGTLRPREKVPITHIDHPAAILRQPVAMMGYLLQKAVVTIVTVAEEVGKTG